MTPKGYCTDDGGKSLSYHDVFFTSTINQKRKDAMTWKDYLFYNFVTFHLLSSLVSV